MKRKIFSKLLMVAMLVASVSSFVSCKDYDDDINNLQDQINKAALQSELAALQQTVANNATAAKAAADAAEAAAKKYADELAAKSTAKADDLEKLIAQVKAVADAAATKDDLGKVEEIAKAAATQAALTEAIAELNGAIEKVKAVADAAATKEELAKAQEELKAAIKKVEDAAAEAKTLAQKAQETADKANTDLAAEVKRAKKAEEDLDAAIKKALEDANKYTDDALTASKKYTDDEVAKAAAKAADDLAKAIAKVYTKTEVDEKIADAKTEAAADAAEKLANALGDLGTATVKEYVNTEIGDAVEDLKEELADTYLTKSDFEKITGVSGSLTASVNALYTAVTNVELFGSYCGFGQTFDNVNVRYMNLYNNQNGGLVLPMLHGFVGENSVFGDETDCGTVANPFEYVKDADIKSAQGIVVRVNPVNADLTDAKIILVNSKGEGLDDYVEAGTPVRYTQLITTRGTDINTGLWIIPFSVKDGIDEEALVAKTQVLDKDGKPVLNNNERPLFILQAIAIKNTDGSEYGDEEDSRYVTSTFDVAPYYVEYEPANDFFFTVDNTMMTEIRNRWSMNEGGTIVAEQKSKGVDIDKYLYPELCWNPSIEVGGRTVYLSPKPSFDGYEIDNNTHAFADVYIRPAAQDQRNRLNGYHLLPVKVDVPFTIANVFQYQINPNSTEQAAPYAPFTAYNYNQIEYYYVTLDCHNAIESSPSEINAWESYNYDGLYTRVKADEPLEITIHDGAKSTATGDVIGFRVYAVNYDGTLADPDGKAFYVYVGDDKSTEDLGAATITATDTLTLAGGKTSDKVLQSTPINVTGKFDSDYQYWIQIASNNQGKIVVNNDVILPGSDLRMIDFFTFIFYNNQNKVIATVKGTNNWTVFDGSSVKNAVKMQVTANIDKAHDIYNLIDNATYSFIIKGREVLDDQADWIDRQVYNFTVQKLLPTEVILPEFRTNQSADGTSFISYMVPDSLNTTEEKLDDETKNLIWDWNNTYTVSYSNLKKKYASYTAATIEGKNYKGRVNGFKDLNNVFYDLNKDTLYHFTFATSNKWSNEKNNLPIQVSVWNDRDSVQIDGVNPPFLGAGYKADGDYKSYKTLYVLSVPRNFIDGTTSHNIDVSHKYLGVSTQLKQDGTLNWYKKTHLATTESAFTVKYASWIQASTFSNVKKPVLQWKTTPEAADTLTLTNIKSVNTYNGELFSKDLSALINAEYLMPVVTKIQFVSANGHVNEYFKPEDTALGTPGANPIALPLYKYATAWKGHHAANDIVLCVTQVSTQLDANPIADHDENLEITVVDAFNIEHKISVPVTIKRAAN